MPSRLKGSLGTLGAGLFLALQALSPAVAVAPPQQVKSVDDLPRFSYSYDGRVADPFTDPTRLMLLVAKFRANSVIVGIWDSGADVAVLTGKLFVNTKERADGKDEDGNGFIDDINGIGFDQNGAPVADLLVPVPRDFAPRLEQTREISQGANDMQAGIQSP